MQQVKGTEDIGIFHIVRQRNLNIKSIASKPPAMGTKRLLAPQMMSPAIGAINMSPPP